MCGIDLVDLPVAILPDPQRPLGPGQARVAPAAGRRDRRQDRAARRIDLEDAVVRDLVEVLAVEGRPGVAGDVERAHALAGRRLEGVQLLAAGEPDQAAVEADAVRRAARPGRVRTRGRSRRADRLSRGRFCHRCSLLSTRIRRRPGVTRSSRIRPRARRASAGSGRGPSARTWPAASSATRARCAVRWLDPERQRERRGRPGLAVGEQRQDRGVGALDRRREQPDLDRPAPRGASVKPPAVARISASGRSSRRRRPSSTRRRARWDAFVRRAPNARSIRSSRAASPGHASARPRSSANSTGRRASRTSRSPVRAARRQPSTTRSGEASTASTSARVSEPRLGPRATRRAAGRTSARAACSTSARSAADARPRRRLAGPRQGGVRRRGPSPAQRDLEADQRGDGREPGGPGVERERGARALRLVDPSEQQEAPDLQQPRVGRVLAIAVRGERAQRLGQRPRRPGRDRAPPARPPPRPSGSAPARRVSRGPKPRAARRSSSRARARSPSWAIAIPRSASAGGIVPQRDALERAERIARAQRAPGRRDRRVHGPILNRVAVVTPTSPRRAIFLGSDGHDQGATMATRRRSHDEAPDRDTGRVARGADRAARRRRRS